MDDPFHLSRLLYVLFFVPCVCQNFQWAQIYLDRTCTYRVVVHECPCWTMPASSEAVVAMDHSRADGLNNQIYKGEKQWLHQHQTRACFCNMLCMMCFKMLFMLIIFFPAWKFDYYLHITWSSLCYYIYHYQSWKRQKNIFQIFFIWKNLFSVIIPLLASMQMWSRSAKYIRTHTYVSFTLIIDLRNLSMVSIERKYNHFWMSLDTHMLLAYYTNIVSPSLDIICQIGMR